MNYHGDGSVSENLRRRVQNPAPVPLPHPLLIREAIDKGAGGLLLIDPVYCGALIEKAGSEFKDFAAAAMDTTLPKIVTKNLEGHIWAGRLGTNARFAATGQTVPAPQPTTFTDRSGPQPEAIPIDPDLLLVRSPGSTADARDLFGRLDQTQDLAAQAGIFDAMDWESLEGWTTEDLVNLGRRLATAAEIGNPSASGFLRDLRDQIASLPEAIANAVYFGALGSAYFDQEGSRRDARGSRIFTNLMDVVSVPVLGPAVTALRALLLRSDPRPIYVPGTLAGVTVLDCVVQAPADGGRISDIIAVNFAGRNLITNTQDVEDLRFAHILGRPAGQLEFTVAEICDAVCRFHLLPRHLVAPDLEPSSRIRVAEFAGVDIDT